MLDKENASNRSRSPARVGLLGRALKTRRLARCSVAVLLLGLLATATYVYLVDHYADMAYGQTPPDPPLPEPGAPRPWEAGIQVSTYCMLNTRTSNLLTAIPLVEWTGRGPAISMVLYHNSSLPVNQAMGFDMGPGWTVSYSSYIELDDPQNPTTATVIADDATLTMFTDDNGWQPPAGVHDILTRDGDTWLLTHKDQSYHQYQRDADGVIRLKRIGDGAGNYLAVGIDPISDFRLKEITDIAGRKLEFIYDANDRLEKIKDPREAVEPPYGNGEFLEDREWVFTYDVDGRLDIITDPAGDRINLDYDTPGRITLITDKYGPPPPYDTPDEYEFAYDTGGDVRLEVTDPEVGGNRLTQQFSLTATVDTITGTYTDQRQNQWEHQYTVVSYPDANLTQLENPLGETRHFSYDADRNAEEYWFGAHPNDKWTFTYDDRGNILTARDPLQHTDEWTYDQYNNVTSYTDAIGNTVEYRYDYDEFFLCSFMTDWHCGTCVGGGSAGSPCDSDLDCDGGSCESDDDHCKYCDPSTSPEQYWYEPCDTNDDCGGGTCLSDTCQVLNGYPALLTRIIEPPTEEGGDPGITTLDYYVQFDLDRCQSGGMNACGHLKEAIDPNGVWTGFEYDQWGQLLVYSEGDVSGTRSDPVLSILTKRNSAGQLVESKTSTGGGRAESSCGAAEWRPRGVANIVCKACLARAGDRQQAPGAPGIPGGPDLPTYYTDWSVPGPDTQGYSPKGELLHLLVHGKRGEDILEYTRTFSYAYDAYGGLTSATINSDEWNSQPSTRTFTHQRDTANGQYTRTGPDGVRTFVQLDVAGRIDHYERGPEGSPIMSADLDYYAHGLLETVQYSNYTSVHYGYDAGLRLTSIDHQDLSGTIRKLQYEYYDNDLISKITESDIIGPKAIVKFNYDSRGRLILEARIGQDPYHMAYEYDQGGNRTKKIQSLGGCNRIETVYHYDYEDPVSNGSYNNRLMYYETYETCRVFEDYGHTGGCGSEELVSTTWYYYNMNGNAVYVVTAKTYPEPEEPKYSGTRLKYARNGNAVTFALGISWDPYAPEYDIDWAREFRYDSPRQRYMNVQLDPKDLEGGVIDPISTVWSDYDGDEIYGDFEIDSQTITELRSFERGIGRFSWDVGVPDPATANYYHTNMIGTTRFMTDSTGADIESAVYTAFGERISGTQHRYGYAGTWGYQAHDDLSFLHLGHRYYDPGTGRFLQRDPIGIRAGPNVYAYVLNVPTVMVDPSGLLTPIAGAAAVGAGAALADGPLPVGDVIGAGIIAGAVCVELYHWFAHRSKKRASTKDKHTRSHSSKKTKRRGRRRPPGYTRQPGHRQGGPSPLVPGPPDFDEPNEPPVGPSG